MTAKSDSSKLSPAERLARKRSAARLRQQRCRARKRIAMLEKRRVDTEQQPSPGEVTPESTTAARPPVARPLPTHHLHHHLHRIQHQPHRIPTYAPAITKPSRAPASASGEHIYNCISFESQRSFEEAQKSLRVQTSTLETLSENNVAIVSPASSPPRNSDVSIVRVLSDEKSDEQLVPEEEAAVAAMLSLKSGTEKSFLFSQADEDRDQSPASSPFAPKVVEESRATVVEMNSPSSASCKPTVIFDASKAYSTPPIVVRHHQAHHPRRIEFSPHYEVYEYGPPPSRRQLPPPPRRVSHPVYYHRVPAGPPPPSYRRGYYAAAPHPVPPRSYTVRYEYE